MGNKYTIRINNNTGSPQNYNLLSEKPEISGVSKSNVWTSVYQSNESCPDGATAEFEIWKSYYGIIGTWRGGARDGGRVTITQTKPVTLGSQSPDGSQNPGTTLNMVVVNGRVPSFDRALAEPSAFVNAFEIDTGNDFTLEMATDSEFSLLLRT
jgi:hypothetical protein